MYLRVLCLICILAELSHMRLDENKLVPLMLQTLAAGQVSARLTARGAQLAPAAVPEIAANPTLR